MERALKKEAKKKGMGKKQASDRKRSEDAYVYGTMRKTTGWKPSKRTNRRKR